MAEPGDYDGDSQRPGWEELDAKAGTFYAVAVHERYSIQPDAIFATEKDADAWVAWQRSLWTEEGEEGIGPSDEVFTFPTRRVSGLAWNSYDPVPDEGPENVLSARQGHALAGVGPAAQPSWRELAEARGALLAKLGWPRGLASRDTDESTHDLAVAVLRAEEALGIYRCIKAICGATPADWVDKRDATRRYCRRCALRTNEACGEDLFTAQAKTEEGVPRALTGESDSPAGCPPAAGEPAPCDSEVQSKGPASDIVARRRAAFSDWSGSLTEWGVPVGESTRPQPSGCACCGSATGAAGGRPTTSCSRR